MYPVNSKKGKLKERIELVCPFYIEQLTKKLLSFKNPVIQ